MLNRIFLCVCTAVTLGMTVPAIAADDPTMHQVYLAAEAGRFADAQAMMDVVLRDHPNSGKAHFVEAELLAKQGRLADARNELTVAERLKPGLPFATPLAVQHLRARLAAEPTQMRPVAYAPPAVAPASGMPWGLMMVAVGLVVLVVLIARAMRRRDEQVIVSSPMQSMGAGTSMPGYGFGAAAPMAPPVAGGGIGSGILGGLATGAAVGAGIVAGEALMHHFTDADRNERAYVPPPQDPPPLADDMGGSDFGIADSGSWDDGTSGGDDWN